MNSQVRQIIHFHQVEKLFSHKDKEINYINHFIFKLRNSLGRKKEKRDEGREEGKKTNKKPKSQKLWFIRRKFFT